MKTQNNENNSKNIYLELSSPIEAIEVEACEARGWEAAGGI